MTEFRINNMRLLLTYSQAGHFDKLAYTEWLNSKSTTKITFCRLAHELGEDKKNPHTHVLIEYTKPFQTRDCRYFDFNGHHPNIKPLKSKKAFEDAKIYIAKEDKENSDLLPSEETINSLFTQVKNCKTLDEALTKFAWKPSDAAGVITLYNQRKRVPSRFEFEPTKGWQKLIVEIDSETPDPRKVYWFWDPKGNSGKTAMAKWLHINRPGNWYIAKDLGTSRDCATIVSNAINSGEWNGWGMIIDLPRSAENHTRMYSYIEEIKDGFVTATKYSGGTVVFDSPHLIVFANWLPNIEALSKDRWAVYDLRLQPEVVAPPLTLKEVAEIKSLSERLTDKTDRPSNTYDILYQRHNA